MCTGSTCSDQKYHYLSRKDIQYVLYVCTLIYIYKDIYSLRENQEAENPFFMFSSLAHILFTVARLFMDIPACFYFSALFLFLSFHILFTLLLSVPFFS